MSDFPGFIGASYRSLSRYAAVERCKNFFLEVIEDPNDKKTRAVLYPTPCTGVLGGDLGPTGYAQINRGMIELNGRLFIVNGTLFFEYALPSPGFPFGVYTQRGTVLDDGSPVGMIANGVIDPGNQQIFIVSGNKGYIFETGTNVFTALTIGGNAFEAGKGCAFLDDYFCSIIPGTNGFQVSALNNGKNWGSGLSPLTINVAYTQGQSDALVNLIANQEYLYLFGGRRSEIWFNQGGQFFPFEIEPGGFIEMGLGAQYALTQANNTIHFLGQDARGGRSMWYINGLISVRCSTHAVEYALSRYSTINDCIAYSFTWRGHVFVRYIFPTANAGWTYDATASAQLGYAVWHENSLTDLQGNTLAPIERSHAYFMGIHVVASGGGEGKPGTIYQFTDDTHIEENPVMLFRYSDDGGYVFGNETPIPVGKAGNYDIRVLADCVGAARDRVFWTRCIDYGDAGGTLPIIRDRICPHLFNENKRVYYHRIEFALQKGIGSVGGQDTVNSFWALTGAYLTFEAGLN